MTATCSIVSAGDHRRGGTLPAARLDIRSDEPTAVAVLAGGCFWCVEGVFKHLRGVLEVLSGYAGGTADTANYPAVRSGTTDHAEVVCITFDPRRISYGELLKVYFEVAHDPTQKDRQGNDIGRQYRSAILFADQDQHDVAHAYIEQLEAARVFTGEIVTELVPLQKFYPAEEMHHDYAARNPQQPYIAQVALPKVAHLHKDFAGWLESGDDD